MKPAFATKQNNPSDSSFELIQRCMSGDHSAQLQVYKLYYKPVFRTCMQIVNDPVVAEELMQESFLLAFEHINAYIGDISFTSWINRFINDAFRYSGKARPGDHS
jgi:DNA-directed RNA polymerase specialized sigma24 family protein